MASDLMKKIKKNSTNDMIEDLIKTELLNDKEVITTDIPGLNVALSGATDGGFTAGVTTIAGKSKSFKTLFALEMAKGFLRIHEDAVLVFFDSEFGSPMSYFESFGEAKERILHVPVTTVEELRTEMMNQIDGLTREEKVIFIVDSIGNLASIKETDDALAGKMTVDMTRAKMVKSLFRLITPRLVMKNIPLITINHTYQTLEMFSKEVMSGGTGNVYAADTILFIGKQQEKEGKEIIGWNFILNVEKSRYVREKSKIPVLVTYDGGIYKYSGIFDLAVDMGMILSPSKGWYEINGEKKRRKDIESDVELMESILNDDTFKEMIELHFKL